MEYTKDNIKEKIIPSFFYNRDATTLLPKCKEYLIGNSIQIDDLKRDFGNLDKVEDLEFWKNFLEIFNGCYEKEIKIEKLQNKDDLKNLLSDLMTVRFDSIFTENESEDFSTKGERDKFLESEMKDNKNIFLNKNNVIRIIKPYEINENRNVAPNTPGKNKSFPNLFIKVDKAKNLFFISGSKNKIDNYKMDLIKKDSGLFENKEIKNFEKFKINVRTFFQELKNNKIYVRQIKFVNPLLFFNIKAKKSFYEVDKIIDSKIYLTNQLDFINIKELKLQYSTNIGSESKQFDFNLKIHRSKNSLGKEYLKFQIIFLGDLRDQEDLQKNIFKILENIGLNQENHYNFPIDYYFNYMINSEKYAEKNIKKILEIDQEDKLIADLIKNGVISFNSEKYLFHKKEFNKYFIERLEKLKDKKEGSDESFEITNLIDEKGRFYITVKISNKTDKKEEHYNVYLNEDIREEYSTITNINLKGENPYFILKNLLDKKHKKILEYLSKKVKHYLIYEYEEVLLREAINAHSWLNLEYCKKKRSGKEETELGKIVELKINILLKYLYRNYFSIGGQDKPDGYLYFSFKEDDNTKKHFSFLIDSKMHERISKSEVGKQFSYKKFSKNKNLPEAKGSILIISRKKIKSSLNEKAIESWKQIIKDFEISFITLEFILKAFELLEKSWVKQNCVLREKILKSLIELADQKINFDNKSANLIEIEDKILKNLQQEINRSKGEYLPQEDNQL